MIRVIVLIVFTLVLEGCGSKFGVIKSSVDPNDNVGFSATPALLRNLPSGNDSYSQGFRHGCKSLLGAVGTGLLRLNSAHIDGFRLTQDRMYARGFSDGGTHCTFYLDWDTH